MSNKQRAKDDPNKHEKKFFPKEKKDRTPKETQKELGDILKWLMNK